MKEAPGSNLPSRERLRLNLDCCRGAERYLYLMELGKLLRGTPDLRSERYLLAGCQSKTWIKSDVTSNRVDFYGDSDSAMVKGLIAVVFVAYQDLTPQEILQFDVPDYLRQLSLERQLTPLRSGGLHGMIRELRSRMQCFLSRTGQDCQEVEP